MKRIHLLAITLSSCLAALLSPNAYSSAAAKHGKSNHNSQCIPAHQFIELLPEKVGSYINDYDERTAPLGMYERVSPDGRYILRSFSGSKLGDVTVLELPDPQLRLSAQEQAQRLRFYRTPLKNEAFPVQGSWRYLVNPDGQHYRFADILKHQTKAKPVFKGGMTGFYAAAAELPHPSDESLIRIRSMSWPNAAGDMDTQGIGNLQVRTITVNPKTHTVTDKGKDSRLCSERARKDGSLFALPMISTDGLEFSALPQKLQRTGTPPTMHIYRFGSSGAGCTLAERFTQRGGKTIFGYTASAASAASAVSASNRAANATETTTQSKRQKLSKRQKPSDAPLAYEHESQIWWYNRDTRQSYNIAPHWNELGMQLTPTQRENTSLLANSFPGITRDGRVIYGAKIRFCSKKPCHEKVGIIITDPYQSKAWRNGKTPRTTARKTAQAAGKNCIRYQDLALRNLYKPKYASDL